MNDIASENDCTQCGAKDGFSSMWWLHDYNGIPVAKVCPACEGRVKMRYRPWVWTGYSQVDIDEPIEPEEG